MTVKVNRNVTLICARIAQAREEVERARFAMHSAIDRAEERNGGLE